MARRVIRPQAAARRTLGSGRHTTMNTSVSAPPISAVARREMPSFGARPRRSLLSADPGGPMRRKRRIERFAPETASKCVRSVALKASWSSGETLEVSPTTSPGSSARASGSRPSVASRSPERSSPAARWTVVGGPVILGRPSVSTRSTAARRSPSWAGGERAQPTRSRVDGRIRCHSSRASPGETMRSTGVRTLVRWPPGAVTSVMSASSRSVAGVLWLPRTPGRVGRGSDVTRTWASTRVCSCASPGTGPRRTSAPCSPAVAPPAAAQSGAGSHSPAAHLPPPDAAAPCLLRTRPPGARAPQRHRPPPLRPPSVPAARRESRGRPDRQRRRNEPQIHRPLLPRTDRPRHTARRGGRAVRPSPPPHPVARPLMAARAVGGRRTCGRRCR
ncbi:hypothetical protein SMICM17S_05992 [Streptomyces microflavus]